MRLAFAPPRLATLLLLSNIAVLALPLTGLWILRLYESTLVRQTESELVAQAAVIAAAYREALRLGAVDAPPAPANTPFVPTDAMLSVALRPGLDMAVDTILPPPPPPLSAGAAAPRAAAIGAIMAPILRDAQAVTLAALRVTDAKGIVVASTGGDLGLSLAGWQEVAQVLGGAPIVTSLRRREEPGPAPTWFLRGSLLRVFVALPVQGLGGVAGVVVLSRTPRDVAQALWGKRWALAGLAAVLLALGALLAAGLSRLITRPLRQVVQQAQSVAAGAESLPLARPGTREVAELSEALTRMAKTLDQRARYITAFAASVSHEFKTPLAALRGAAELLDEPTDTLPPAERQRLLSVLTDNSARLDRLVRRLLELARADMMRAGAAPTPIAPILAAIASNYAKRGLAIDTEVGACTATLPADAIEAIFASLLDNVLVHVGAGAQVSIRAEMIGGLTRIDIHDDGPGISTANAARVFEPFFTTARANGGTGMGLPIVQAIARGVGGNAALLPSGHGTRIRIELPAAAPKEQKSFASFLQKRRLFFFEKKKQKTFMPEATE